MDRKEWDDRYAQAEFVWSAEPSVFVVDEVSGLRPGRALDVVCGEGRNALWLVEQGWDVVAVDYSETAIDKARLIADRSEVSVDWRVGDVTDPAAAGGTFDLVIVAYPLFPNRSWKRSCTASPSGWRPKGPCSCSVTTSTTSNGDTAVPRTGRCCTIRALSHPGSPPCRSTEPTRSSGRCRPISDRARRSTPSWCPTDRARRETEPPGAAPSVRRPTSARRLRTIPTATTAR